LQLFSALAPSLRLLLATTRLVVPVPMVGLHELWVLVRPSVGVEPARHAAACPQTPSIRESRHRHDAAIAQRQGALPCMADPSSLHACTFTGRILSGASPPDRIGACSPDTAVAVVPCRAGPRSTTEKAREGSAVAVRPPAASPRQHHSSPPLIGQLLFDPCMGN
jgi:hypothetical protein